MNVKKRLVILRILSFAVMFLIIALKTGFPKEILIGQNEPTSILVTSDPPGAKVYVEHRYKGITPIEVLDLMPAEHMVRVIAEPDYLVFQKSVDTGGRQPAQLHAVLVPTSLTFFKRGVAFFRTGDIVKAKEFFENAVRGQPKKIPDALYFLAVIAKMDGDNTLAVELLREHAFYRPDAFRTHFLLGGLYEDIGRLKEAVTSYKLAALLVPGLGIKLDRQMVTTWSKIKILERKLKQAPYNTVLLVQLGHCYEQKGRLREALKYYKGVAGEHNSWLDQNS